MNLFRIIEEQQYNSIIDAVQTFLFMLTSCIPGDEGRTSLAVVVTVGVAVVVAVVAADGAAADAAVAAFLAPKVPAAVVEIAITAVVIAVADAAH